MFSNAKTMEHNYSKINIFLSSYAENLDSTAKQDYIFKLKLRNNNNEVVLLDDPYFISDWKSDMSLWPAITMTDIEAYLDKFPGLNYRSREAFNYVVAGKVQNTVIHVPPQLPEFVVMKADVHPSMRSNDPYKAWVISTSSGEIQTAHCTCIVGLGEVCSHVTALMYTIQFAVQSKITGVPTEKRCQWNSNFSKKVKAAPLKDVSFKKVKLDAPEKYGRKSDMLPITSPEIPKLNKSELDSFREVIPNAVFWSTWTDDSDTDSADEEEKFETPPAITEIIQKHNIVDVESLIPHFDLEMIKHLEVKTRTQNSLLWKEQRRGRLTASNFGEILRKKSVSEKFLKKFTHLAEEVNVPSIKWGKKNEIKAYKKYLYSEKEKHIKFSLRKAGFHISLSDPYLGCSPDGIVECECCGTGVIEIKCPYKYRNQDPRSIASIDSKFYLDAEGTLKEDSEYYAQVQGSMAITKTDYCDFIVYTNIDIYIQRIRSDVYFWEQNKPILEAFYFKEVLPALKKL